MVGYFEENHIASIAPGYFSYNFVKIQRTLRVTPAMAAGVTDRLWDVEDLVAGLGSQRAEGGKTSGMIGSQQSSRTR